MSSQVTCPNPPSKLQEVVAKSSSPDVLFLHIYPMQLLHALSTIQIPGFTVLHLPQDVLQSSEGHLVPHLEKIFDC